MVELTDWLRGELVRRAEAEAPNECCGLISRARPDDRYPEGRISLWAAENASDRPDDAFFIAPAEQLALLREIEKQGHQLVGIYHSHPKSPPTPSQTDRTIAEFWPDVAWIIVGRVECPNCDGGYVYDVEPECCGNTIGGECRGDCAVPKQVERQCSTCGGEATVPDFWAGPLP